MDFLIILSFEEQKFDTKMKNTICLFEDEGVINLQPLTFLRPVYDLRCGILTLREKVALRFPKSKLILHSRNILTEVLKERYPGNEVNSFDAETILFINGRFLFDDETSKLIAKQKNDFLLVNNSNVLAARLSGNNLSKIKNDLQSFVNFSEFKDVHTIETDTKLIEYPWHLVNNNGTEILNDYKLLRWKKKSGIKKFKSVELINRKNIFIDKNSRIDPFAVLDASGGPIYIGRNVRIMSHAVIQGPAFIGDNTTIKMHASIYHNTSIGEVCKVGGEVEESIIHSYSNKQHEGFLGHAYLGSWVNIGASTNNSDLKNNYANVDVYINGKHLDSGSQFVGLILGDHSKTAINTMFNTGTVVGVSCNIFGAGFPAKFIPSFTWGGSDFLRTYHVSKSLEVAKVVMNRRNIELTKTEEDLINKIFEITESERTSRNMH